jgi:hypothetical protein
MSVPVNLADFASGCSTTGPCGLVVGWCVRSEAVHTRRPFWVWSA